MTRRAWDFSFIGFGKCDGRLCSEPINWARLFELGITKYWAVLLGNVRRLEGHFEVANQSGWKPASQASSRHGYGVYPRALFAAVEISSQKLFFCTIFVFWYARAEAK